MGLGWLACCPLILRYAELLGQFVGKRFADVLARAPPAVLLGPVEVPVGSMALGVIPGALLAAILAALDALEAEVASAAAPGGGFWRPPLLELPAPGFLAFLLDVGDRDGYLQELCRVQRLQPLPIRLPLVHRTPTLDLLCE